MPTDSLNELAGRPFSTAEARRAGIGRRHVHHRRSARPFRGVRATTAPTDVLELCAACLPKMAEHEFFSHVTSAVLHGMWLPLALARRMELDVAVVEPRRGPHDAGVHAHHLIDRPWLVTVRKGMRTANEIETLCQLATVLDDDDDLVVAAESHLPPRRATSAVRLDRILAAFADQDRRSSRRLARAASRIRIGSRSAQEMRVRLLLVGGPARAADRPPVDRAGRPHGRGRPGPPRGAGVDRGRGRPAPHGQAAVAQGPGPLRAPHGSRLAGRPDQRADDLALRPDETIARVRRALARTR